MADPRLNVVITAKDRAGAVVKAIEAKFAGLGNAANKTARSFGAIGRAAGGAAGTVAKVATPLAALTSAASVGGMVALTEAWARFGQRLGFDATRIGVTVDKLHALQGAARLAGGSGDAMTAGMRSLQDTLQDVAGGQGGEAAAYMNAMGVALTDSAGRARKAADVLPEVARAIAAIKNPTLQARVATVMFGGAAEDLLPLLRKGAAGIAELEAKARSYGVVDEAGAKRADETRGAYAGLMLAVEGLGNGLSERLSPALNDLLGFFSELIKGNRTKIIETIGTQFEKLVKWVKEIDWNKVGEQIGQLFDKLKGIMDTIMSFDPPPWLRSLLGIKSAAAATLPDGAAPPAVPTIRDSLHGAGPTAHGPGTLARSEAVPPEGRALLDQIGLLESDNNYDEGHPKRPDGTDASTATGKYQFLDSTRDEVSRALGLNDWGRESQDRAAWYYAQQRYAASTQGRDLLADLRSGNDPTLKNIGPALSQAWPSLPGGSQTQRRSRDFDSNLKMELARLRDQGGGGDGAEWMRRAAGPAPVAAAQNGHVKVDVQIAGAPAGTTARAQATGSAQAGVRVEQAGVGR